MPLPPAPQESLTVQLLRWTFTPMQYIDECTQKYGDIFCLYLDKKLPVVFTSSPDALQTILTSDTKDFSSPGELNEIFTLLFGNYSLITLSGKEHRRQRQLLMPSLHGERMRTYAELMEDITTKVINKLHLGTPFAVRDISQAITLQIMMQAVFGLYDTPRARRLEKLLGDILEKLSSPWSLAGLYFPLLGRLMSVFDPARDFERLRQQADDLIYEEIRERRENFDASRTDILSMLIAARDENGNAMGDVELRDELITLLSAGHETTATAIAWAIYFIHKYPDVKAKLLNELDTLGGKLDANLIVKLPYLNAVCNETLRIHPVGMFTFGRKVETPVSLCGYSLEAGTVVIGSIYSVHRREDLYPNCHEFKPERFLERQFSNYEFIPFGGGVRRCIGLALAQFEMKVVLTKILTSVNLELITKQEVLPVRRGLVSGPNRPIRMVVKSWR